MSAIEQFPPYLGESTSNERRNAPRHRVREPLSVNLGRGEGTLVDISATGARVRHAAPVRLGTQVRISFEWEKQRFGATALVLASRVTALGDAQRGATTFESRLRFVALTSDAADILTDFIHSLDSRDLRKWVANLRGWSHDETADQTAGTFIRCRPRFRRWETKWTRDSRQPEDGFTVPASTSESELALLCRTWDESDEIAREILRESARASVESSLA